MIWNTKEIGFLHQPEFFLGSFDNPKMQERHQKELEKSLNALKVALAKESDPLAAMTLLNPKDHIQFLLNNFDEFKRHGRLEQTVLTLYLKLNRPFSSGGDAALWNTFFKECDPSNLRQCGQALPPNITKVYRGSVSGKKKRLAWTHEKSLVDAFAERWEDPSLGGGELYEVDICSDNVLLYCEKMEKRRVEKIIILDPDFIENAEIRSYHH